MNRADWGCDDSQLQYIQMGIEAWLETKGDAFRDPQATEALTRFEVYPTCPENENVFSRIYEVDGRLVIRLYAYNIIQATQKYKVYTKLLTMFLIAHEVAHIIYQERNISLIFLKGHPSEEQYCDEIAENYMLNIYSMPAINGILEIMHERAPLYHKQAQATREAIETKNSTIKI
jgi:hypothetical protein